jgi:DNA-binding GntR family transcriptional regulator
MAIDLPPRAASVSKADAVYTALKQAITGGRLTPGTRLRQDEIAAHWAVSSTPVREAFRRLEAEGLVELLPHRGVVVSAKSSGSPLVDAGDLSPGSDFP